MSESPDFKTSFQYGDLNKIYRVQCAEQLMNLS